MVSARRRLSLNVAAALLVLSAACGCGSPGGTGSLADMLARTWIGTTGMAGDCLNPNIWYTFGADGSLIERDIDENACSGTRLVQKLTGVYTLRDRVLEMTLPGRGYGPSYLSMPTPNEPVAKMVERFPIIVAPVAPPWTGAGHLALDGSAYTGADGAHYQSRHYLRMDGASGSLLFEQDMTFDLTVNPPLPLAAGQTCQVQIDFTLAQFDAASTENSDNDTFSLTYDAIISATEDGWLDLKPAQLEGLTGDQVYVTWHRMLDQAGLSQNHSVLFAWLFDAAFNAYLAHRTDDPRVLTQTLPLSGRWLEATRALPIQ